MSGGIPPAIAGAPEGFFLTPATRELLEIVIKRGTDEDRAHLRPFEHYLWSLDPRHVAQNELHDRAHEELCDLVMEMSDRWTP